MTLSDRSGAPTVRTESFVLIADGLGAAEVEDLLVHHFIGVLAECADATYDEARLRVQHTSPCLSGLIHTATGWSALLAMLTVPGTPIPSVVHH